MYGKVQLDRSKGIYNMSAVHLISQPLLLHEWENDTFRETLTKLRKKHSNKKSRKAPSLWNLQSHLISFDPVSKFNVGTLVFGYPSQETGGMHTKNSREAQTQARTRDRHDNIGHDP